MRSGSSYVIQQGEMDIDAMLNKAQKTDLSSLKYKYSRPKKVVMKEDVNDGWSDSLCIYKPKPTITELPEEISEKGFQYFRDPNSRQWISVKQVCCE